MSKSRKTKSTPTIQLAKNALSQVNLGQVFAEYDSVLKNSGSVFVKTPAIVTALDPTRSKCFFVGRRGTGKTAMTYFIKSRHPSALMLQPQTFNANGLPVDSEDLKNASQRHFRSLVSCFKRALVDEVLIEWIKDRTASYDTYRSFSIERNYLDDKDFDLRMLELIERTFTHLKKPTEKDWLRDLKAEQTLIKDMESVSEFQRNPRVLLIDRIDDAWDGSGMAVLFLMALMHACVELSSQTSFIRPLLFVRENIFERVKQVDNEYARLATCVVSLDWTEELLIELIERRLQANLNPKPAIGNLWDMFFELYEGHSSRKMVFDYCQLRPRDILTYCSLAIDSAVSRTRAKVTIEDLQEARKRFSQSRLKDLGDEYSENFPQLQLILSYFHGLGTEFTISGVDSLIKKLLVDPDVCTLCKSWFFDYTTPSRFMELLYSIGFWGVRSKGKEPLFRSVGIIAANMPAIDQTTHVVIHPSYQHGLDLPNRVITDLDTDLNLQKDGLILDIPDAISINDYSEEVGSLLKKLDTIPSGHEGQSNYEALIGRMIELCFFRSLTNIEAQIKDAEGRVIRDWIASNRASDGFWEVIRSRYHSTQVIWECKNYDGLTPSDFHQMGYYLNDTIGTFGLVCFRGNEIAPHYYGHLKRLADKEKKFLLLLTEGDVKVFLRQAMNGKVKESHIQDIYDKTIRKIS